MQANEVSIIVYDALALGLEIGGLNFQILLKGVSTAVLPVIFQSKQKILNTTQTSFFITCQILKWPPGDCLNIKMLSYQYRNYHYKDKTVLLQSYLYIMEITIPAKMVFMLRQGSGDVRRYAICRYVTDLVCVDYSVAEHFTKYRNHAVTHMPVHVFVNTLKLGKKKIL